MHAICVLVIYPIEYRSTIDLTMANPRPVDSCCLLWLAKRANNNSLSRVLSIPVFAIVSIRREIVIPISLSRNYGHRRFNEIGD